MQVPITIDIRDAADAAYACVKQCHKYRSGKRLPPEVNKILEDKYRRIALAIYDAIRSAKENA